VEWKVKLGTGQRIVAGAVCGGVLALAIWGRTWPFRSLPNGIEGEEHPSIWQYLLGDRTTLGFIRLGLVFASVFLIASVVALSLAGRWMSDFGRLSIDEKETVEERITGLEAQLRQAQDSLEEERRQKEEAEDWADALIGQLDETRLELDAARDELEFSGGSEE
jgi:hypothetical protein